MSFQGQIPALEIFLGLLGFGFSILFCTAFCRACQRFRDDRLEREEWLRAREADRPTSVFVIPVQAARPRLASVMEELPGHGPPRYSVTVASGPPPAYNELDFKPEDLPPGYTEHSPVPSYSLPSSPTFFSPTSLGPTSLGPTSLGPTPRSPTSPNMGPNQTEVFTAANVARE